MSFAQAAACRRTPRYQRTAFASSALAALTWAGALSLADAVRLVRARGEAMQAASDERASGMLSLVGATRESASALVEAARGDDVLVLANLLAPGQIAIAGTQQALDRAAELLREYKIRKAVRLSVAGAFHSPCMASAQARLAEALEATTIREPDLPVVLNVTGEPTRDPALIADALRRQVVSPVLWQASMEALLEDGVSDFLEPAPGKQLTNMLRRYETATTVTTVASADELEGASRWPGGEA